MRDLTEGLDLEIVDKFFEKLAALKIDDGKEHTLEEIRVSAIHVQNHSKELIEQFGIEEAKLLQLAKLFFTMAGLCEHPDAPAEEKAAMTETFRAKIRTFSTVEPIELDVKR